MTALSNVNSQIIERYAYDAFGNVRILTPGMVPLGASRVGNTILFTGRRWDAESGLYDYRARVYHPILGRFLQTDPLGYIDSMNLYQYGLNNPLYWSDPYGLSIWESIANGIEAFENTGFAQYTNDVREFLIGEGEGLLDVGKGVVNTVAHPIQTAQGIGNAVMHPIDTAKGLYDSTLKKVGQFFGDDMRAAGRVTGQAAGSAALSAIGAKGLQKLDCLIFKGGCFVAGTEVLTPRGIVSIEDIQAGDIVWAWDIESSCPVLEEVARTFIREVDCLVILRVGDETIETTTEHPFWVVGSGWIEAKDLRPGHLLLAADGDYLPVDKVSLEYHPATVYNFEVADAHDYFVSDKCVLVHNAPCSTLPRAANGDYLPDPAATGPHTTLGVATSRKVGVYRQGATFDGNGRFLGRTDVTSHGRGSPNPHFHPAASQNGVLKNVHQPIEY